MTNERITWREVRLLTSFFLVRMCLMRRLVLAFTRFASVVKSDYTISVIRYKILLSRPVACTAPYRLRRSGEGVVIYSEGQCHAGRVVNLPADIYGVKRRICRYQRARVRVGFKRLDSGKEVYRTSS